jgi:3-dehydroquinate dehydratase
MCKTYKNVISLNDAEDYIEHRTKEFEFSVFIIKQELKALFDYYRPQNFINPSATYYPGQDLLIIQFDVYKTADDIGKLQIVCFDIERVFAEEVFQEVSYIVNKNSEMIMSKKDFHIIEDYYDSLEAMHKVSSLG